MTGATGVHLLLRNPDEQLAAARSRGDGSHHPASSGTGRGPGTAVGGPLRRTNPEPLLVNDATRDDRFARDPYFAGLDCCSLLVVPILNQGCRKHCSSWRTGSSAARSPPNASTASCSSPDNSPSPSTTPASTPHSNTKSPNAPTNSPGPTRLETAQHHRRPHRRGQPAPPRRRPRRRMAARQRYRNPAQPSP